MLAKQMRTDAEAELERQFRSLAARLGGDEAARAARAAAMSELAAAGLPHRRNEDWKYTDLRTGLSQAFPPPEAPSAPVDEAALAQALRSLATLDARRLVFVDGFFAPEHSSLADLGPGIRVVALGKAGASAVFPRSARAAANAVLPLNDAFATDGASIEIAASAHAPRILLLMVHTAAAPRRITTRHLVTVGADATATIIEAHVRIGAAELQTSTSTTLRIADRAAVSHLKLDAEGPRSLHLAHWDVILGEAAVYHGFQLTAGAGLARNDITVGFTGPDARIDVSGLMLGRGKDHIDTTLVVDHTTTGCESRELFKAVLDDQARAVFQGKVVVAAEAQKTDGKQMAQALLLSESAEFDSKPELEIYADDVACGHGSTATELDADMLFYLRSRGIGLPEARALLIESFAAGALDRIADEPLREAARAFALAWLGARP